jgi:hypothetical protein
MTNKEQPPIQNLDLNNRNDGMEVEQNLNSSSTSSSSHPILSCFGNLARRNMEMGLEDSSDFFNGFLDISKKKVFQKFYSKDPAVMPNKEIKPLKFI